MTVESFFQNDTQEGLIHQVNWIQKKIGVSDEFFLKILGVDEKSFYGWKTGRESIPEDVQERLKRLWQVVLHILSFLNFDLTLVRAMLEYRDEGTERSFSRSSFDPPWVGTSMKAYLETKGPTAIEKIDRWVQGIRFANSY